MHHAPRVGIVLFHIIARSDWSTAEDAGVYEPAGLGTEGFIHLSQRGQILRPANLLYAGRDDLVLLVIDPERVEEPVVFEPGSHGESEDFPHLYGSLNVDAVIDVLDFPCEGNGSFVLPAGLPS